MSKLAFRAQTVDIAYLPLRQDLFAKTVLMTAQRVSVRATAPPYLATARPGGIFFEISPFKKLGLYRLLPKSLFS